MNSILVGLLGLCYVGRYYGAYIGISEFVHSNFWKNVLQSYLLSWDTFTNIIISLYYEFISKHWEYFQLGCIAVQVIGMVLIYFIPESPEYLYSVQKFQQAKQVVKQIAKFN